MTNKYNHSSMAYAEPTAEDYNVAISSKDIIELIEIFQQQAPKSRRAARALFAFKVRVCVTVALWFISLISLFAFMGSYEMNYSLMQVLPGILVSGAVLAFTSVKLGLFK